MTEQKSRWFDARINLQTLLFSVLAVALSTVVTYYGMVQKVQKLEYDVAALKIEVSGQKVDMKDALKDIAASVDRTNTKVDKLTELLYGWQAGAKIPHRD